MSLINKDSIGSIREKTADNIILIDKPADWTSFDVVKKIRNMCRIRRVGHGGTLDPFATGLLIIGTGKKTRSLTAVGNSDKSYLATIELGKTTDTYDVTGACIRDSGEEKIPVKDIQEILDTFGGDIEQVPPMFSAKKVNGTRLYKLARKGKVVEREPRMVHIHEIRSLSRKNNEFKMFVKCSKGTYIRSLADDIGKKIGCGAYLKELRRLSVNDYKIEQALTMEEFKRFWFTLN